MTSQLVKGNAAAVVGALYAGCECFFGYPITPASEILHEASVHFPRVGRVFVQAESEEAAISMVYGAASAGRRAMSASSGPGMSLMQEGISYLAGSQLPAVLVDIMRAGPGLGNIGPEQGDYNQIVKGGGHGNYHLIVLAPNSVQEMCDLTIRAFDLSFRYRTPAVVLADGVLGQMAEPLRFPTQAVTPTLDESWAVTGTAATRKNLVTSIFLDFAVLEEHNRKLQGIYAHIASVEQDAETYFVDGASVVLVAYGISSRIAHTAVDVCRARGLAVGLIRPKTLWPFPTDPLHEAVSADVRAFVSVEMSNGQLADDIRLAIDCRKPVELVSRLGGNLMTVEDIVGAVRRLA